MNRPRLFLSAVSEELQTARKEVTATVRNLGFDPVSQDDFPTGYGELRKWLREQIDSCEGLIQLIGYGYGAEPPEVDPDYGRVSYTQFEFLYASSKDKKTWAIVIGEDYHRDRQKDELDLPRETDHPDPAGYQAERRKLQGNYIARLTQENHLRYNANNDTELQNIVLRLRDELRELRQRVEGRMRRLTVAVIAILLGIAVLGGGGWWAYQKLSRSVQQASVVNTEKIRAHLLQTIEETHRRELAEADAIKDWKERQRLREAADNAHAVRLARIEDLATSFGEIEGRGSATSVFQEMTRILTEQGVDEAIAYVATQRPSILKTVQARAAAARERNRADLQPLLRTAGLHETKGQAAEARALYTDILTVEPDWSEALHAAFLFLTDQGSIARFRTTITDALENYEEAHRLSKRLTEIDPTNTEWQRNLSESYYRFGNVAIAQGKLEEAASAYGESFAIAKKLAEANPTNTEWQRNLSVSYERLGDVALWQDKLEEAASAYSESLTIRKKLIEADPTNTEWQRDLSVSYERLGNMAVGQGKLKEAARAYGESLTIAKKLVEADPTNALWQYDLSVSYNRLGSLAVGQRKLKEAEKAYGESLAIRKKLAESFPTRTGWQRQLSVSYNIFGDVALWQDKLEEAASAYSESLTIRKKLAESDPTHALWQRDLSVSYEKLGDVARAQFKMKEAASAYGESLAIRKKLAESDPINTQWQRDLCESYYRLAVLSEWQLNEREAKIYWKQAFDVLSGIEKRGVHLSPADRRFLKRLRLNAGVWPR
jgi:tetratricopeptide (TPR) repeat protein